MYLDTVTVSWIARVHPSGRWLGLRPARHRTDAPSAQVGEKQHVVRDQAGTGPNFLREEVSRPSDFQMRLDELIP